MNKVEELFKSAKLDEILRKRDQDKRCKTILIILAIIGGIAVIAGIAYAVYRYLSPKYLTDFEDEFEDEFDEDFFDDDEDGEISIVEAANVQNVNCSGRGITDITGLESCPNLKYLNFSNNSRADADVVTRRDF